MTVATEKRLSNLHVKNIEEEIMLIKEAEVDYKVNGWMSARKSYIKWLKFIDNLKI